MRIKAFIIVSSSFYVKLYKLEDLYFVLSGKLLETNKIVKVLREFMFFKLI